MALDIRNGDYLVVDGQEYPIRSCAAWAWPYNSFAMRRLQIKVASTKRAPALTGGKRGPLATVLTGLRCTPLDPVDPEVRERLALAGPHTVLETFVAGCDVYYHLVIEDMER